MNKLILLILLIFYLINCFYAQNLSIYDNNNEIPSKWEPLWHELFPKKNTLSTVRFYLYTRLNRLFGQELCINDELSIKKSNFNADKRTIFLINGWQDNRLFAKWVRNAINLLLQRDDMNVIYVGWQSINELFIAAIIIQSYSVYLSKFINFLKYKYHLNGEQIHCIGHSLGGFMCGFAGDQTYIGRVTVMDAGPRPYFQRKPSSQRLNRFQAGFMDVIHSDFHPTFSLGLTIPYGDLDFFPNSGTVQDGCWRDKWYKSYEELTDGEGILTSLFQFVRYLFFCSHYRSHEWFFESLSNQQCQFIGVLCPNYQMFINGECSCQDFWIDGHGETTCAIMGYDAEYAILKQGLTKFSPLAKWYLKTSDFYHYTNQHCQYQYQLIVKLGKFFPLFNYNYNQDYQDNITLTISFINNNNKNVILNELIYSNNINGDRLRSNYQLNKLILQPYSLPMQKIYQIFITLSSSTMGKNFFITIKWIKLSPIHIVNNEPNYYCHLNQFVWNDKSKLMKLCNHF